MLRTKNPRVKTAMLFIVLALILVIAGMNIDFSVINLTGFFTYNVEGEFSIMAETVIYSDNFESGSLNGWTTSSTGGAGNWAVVTTDPAGGTYHAQSNPQAAGQNSTMEKNVSTQGYQNITLNYSRKLIGLDTVDYFYAQWYDGNVWSLLEFTNSATDSSYVIKSFSLPTANNNSNFKIRFICTAGAVSEYCRVDNVAITGIIIDSTAPQFSSYIESPTNGSIYTAGTTHYFNVSITEANFATAKITFNGTNYSTINSSGTHRFNISNLSVGIYTYTWWANDTNGNSNTSATRTYHVLPDTAAPQFSSYLESPTNNTVYAPGTTHYFNVTINATTIATATITFNGTNYSLTNQSSTYYFIITNLTTGIYQYSYWANATNGNSNTSATRTYHVAPDTTAPTLTLYLPTQGQQYGQNTSMSITYTATDTNLQSCWYNLNHGSNTSLTSCSNTSFSTPNGAYTLYLYANDTFGNTAMDSATFNVNVGAPSITQGSPENYTNTYQVTLNYTPDDSDGVDTCELWGDLGNGYELNQTDNTITSGISNTYTIAVPEGNYYWNIRCNDTYAYVSQTTNKSFTVDTTYPTVTLTEPTGTKNTRTNIPITYTTNDTYPDTCWYNVYRGVVLEVTNTSIICNQTDATLNVTLDADFILTIYAKDLAGNQNSTSTSFTVDTSGGGSVCGDATCNGAETCNTCSSDCGVCPTCGDATCNGAETCSICEADCGECTTGGGGGGGGGGSGGSSSGTTSSVLGARLEIKEINAIMTLGEQKSLTASVKNNGRVAANKCKLTTNKENQKYLEATDIKNIGVGEIVDFRFNLKATTNNISTITLQIECFDNISATVPLKLKLIKPNINAKITSMNFEGNSLIIGYSISSITPGEQTINFNLKDNQETIIEEQIQTITLTEAEYQGTTTLPLEKAKQGMLKVTLLDQNQEALLEETVIYDGTKGITGRAIFGGRSIFSPLGITIGIFGLLILAVGITILRKSKR